MFLTKVDISKTAYFMTTQTFSQEVTKFIPCDDVTRFDGTKFIVLYIHCYIRENLSNKTICVKMMILALVAVRTKKYVAFF